MLLPRDRARPTVRRVVALLAASAAGLVFSAHAGAQQPLDPSQEEDEMPPGHPPSSSSPGGAGGDPHGGAPREHSGGAGGGGGAGSDGYQPPEDVEEEDARLPPGTIEVELRDDNDKPIPKGLVTLSIINNSIAKGESKKKVLGTASEAGVARFDGLEIGSLLAYGVLHEKDGATFAATPFQLSVTKGMKVILHAFPVAHDIESTLVVMQSMIYVEIKDDRIQIQQAVNLFNFGRVAWVPGAPDDDVILHLPEDFTALTSNDKMANASVEPIAKKGARLRGTFGPGRHSIEFRWQLPYSGSKDVEIEVGAPPHLAAARVMAAASHDMRLQVEGFPDPLPDTDGQGTHILVADREMRREDAPLQKMKISLRDLPTAGPARIVATCIAGAGMFVGLIYAANGTRKRSPKETRALARAERLRLLTELEDLERGRIAGNVGPKTYERARRQVLDRIARTL
jgi:hypothetical protein